MRNPNAKRGCLRFTLRTLVIAIGIACVLLGLFANRLQRARREAAAIAALRGLGATVYTTPDDLFSDRVLYVEIKGNRISDDDLIHLKSLPPFDELTIESTPITDRAIEHLVALTELKRLDLKGTLISKNGFEELQRRLPQCKITYE